MYRAILKELNNWKQEEQRKVLLIRGARQVGKTYIVREFGQSFEYFIEVNFDETAAVHSFFEGNLDPDLICENLSAYYGIPAKDHKTLLFFDEVQACQGALRALRYFYEKRPGLHLVATGSLLEFAFRELASFGVGRIRSLFMYSLSFDEFLIALEEEQLIKVKQRASIAIPLNNAFHEKLLLYYSRYILVGGMPAVVKSYIADKDLLKCQDAQNDIIISLQSDFPKYKKRIPSIRIFDVFKSVAYQSGNKFKHVHAGPDYSSRQVKDVLELLILAGLVHPVYHTSGQGLPLGASVNTKKAKMLFFDTGIMFRILGLKLSDALFPNDFNALNRGNMAEVCAGLELIKASSPYEKPELYYWQREARSSNAEVDYIIQVNNNIVPIEVKAGSRGQMQSLHMFMNERKTPYGIRASLENFSSYSNIRVIPLYAIQNIV
jgi:predicted AAA+ superfamily ATPase